jgi:hypothetical protein
MSDNDPRLILWCRLGLLVVSLLHWTALGVMVWQNAHPVAPPAGVHRQNRLSPVPDVRLALDQIQELVAGPLAG